MSNRFNHTVVEMAHNSVHTDFSNK